MVVTNPFHQVRSLLTFRCAAKEAGLRDLAVLLAVVDPLAGKGQEDGQPLLAKLRSALWLEVDMSRELAALAWYWLRGWLC